jgi:homoserine O-acetyltransferase|tara:strand:+ start:211 stop:1356 length:1146 start_codon:yes stop_codon:yes gene_type:complete
MPDKIPDDSVGLVTPQTIQVTEPLSLISGQQLDSYTVIYETYGELNANRDNAVLICHALSGDHHAAGYHSMEDRKPGWWDSCIGPGKPIDTNKFFVVCVNNLGGCGGTTGPTSPMPGTDTLYGPDFPLVTVKDWVASQAQVSSLLGIEQWLAVIGGSLGGMQALQWAIDFPEKLKHAIVIASAPRLSAQNIAFNEVARQAILSDPEFHEGRYYEHDTIPSRGLRLARMLGHITYLSDEAMHKKFGRELRSGQLKYSFDVEFQVESYLRYQGESFIGRFDANTYLLMTKALDYFDPAGDYEGHLDKALQRALCKFFVVSFSSDWRFAPERSEEIVHALVKARRPVDYVAVDAHQGHDAFLLNIPYYIQAFHAYMDKVAGDIA